MIFTVRSLFLSLSLFAFSSRIQKCPVATRKRKALTFRSFFVAGTRACVFFFFLFFLFISESIESGFWFWFWFFRLFVWFVTGRLATKSYGVMRRRLLVAMSTVEKCPCLKTLPANISIGFSLSIRYYFIHFQLVCIYIIWDVDFWDCHFN